MLVNICHLCSDIPLSNNPFKEICLKETLFNIFVMYNYIDIDRYMTHNGNMMPLFLCLMLMELDRVKSPNKGMHIW